jgi:hypothetical protein
LPPTDTQLKSDHGAPDASPDNLQYACFRRIASAWASFESEIDKAICVHGYMKDEIGVCVTAQLIGIGPRFKLLIALLRLNKSISAKSIELMNRQAQNVGKLVRKRNRAVEYSLKGNDHSGRSGQFPVAAHGEPDHEAPAASLAELEILESEIIEKQKRFQELSIRIANEVYVMWKKEQP